MMIVAFRAIISSHLFRVSFVTIEATWRLTMNSVTLVAIDGFAVRRRLLFHQSDNIVMAADTERSCRFQLG